MSDTVKKILSGYAEVFFISDYRYGIFFLSGTMFYPNVGLGGVIAVMAAILFAKIFKLEREYLSSGAYVYNPLLTGLTMGYFYVLNFPVMLLIVFAGIFTFMLTLALSGMFRYYFRLPVLSLPFVIAGAVMYLACLKYPALFYPPYLPAPFAIFNTDFNLPLWAVGFFKSSGTLLFSPCVATGVLFAVMILFYSRILFILAVAGYFAGTLTRMWLTGCGNYIFYDIYGFNYILVGMAVGGVFLVPSKSSYLFAVISAILSAFVLDAFYACFQGLLPAFALPFNMIVMLVLYCLIVAASPMLAGIGAGTPEEKLENYITNILRFPSAYLCHIYLPFSGIWTVWQGSEGQWTHRGEWANAFDFVVKDENGKTFSGDGSRLEDYHAFKKPVLSPVRGKICKVIAELPDSPIGIPDPAQNWGNHVIIENELGFSVKISHFCANSIRVKEGERVERGTVLGSCGNSGYSPQPHIHVQCQLTSGSSETIPFAFLSYATGKSYFADGSPVEHSRVEPLYPEKSLEDSFNFLLDDKFEYEVLENDIRIDEFVISVKMAVDGTMYFDSGRGKLYFGRRDGTFYFYRVDGYDKFLKMFFAALPSIPLSYRDAMSWTDFLPAGTAVGGFRKIVAIVGSSFYHSIARVRSNLRFDGKNHVSSVIESRMLGVKKTADVEIDTAKGIKTVKINKITIRRKTNAESKN